MNIIVLFTLTGWALLLASVRSEIESDRLPSATYSPNYEEYPNSTRDSVTSAISLVKQKGCDLRICFAIDGSASINETEFADQKRFVNLVGEVIASDKNTQIAAVQYGLRLWPISRLTSDFGVFKRKLTNTKSRKARRTFIAPGLGFCVKQLQKVEDAHPKYIVLLGDGRSNFDSTLPSYDPRVIARKFMRSNKARNSVLAIAVNYDDITDLENMVGSRDRVYEVDEWYKVTRIIREFVERVCGAKPGF